ncbi:MAG: SDR family oxidoreductase [Solirubrobacteraceae bacterium]
MSTHTGTGETVLLTGATGFVGMEVLARLLEQDDVEVICLVRAPSRPAAQGRLQEVYGRLYDEPPAAVSRVSAIAGDISVDGLGLGVGERDELLARVTSIVHCAALISFDLPLETARQTNSAGAVRMLELARAIADRRGQLRRFVHVSTAYVAGRHHGRFREADLDLGQGFRNTYEQSKFDGEQAIARAASELPIVVARPSIVVGDSRSGWTPVFNVIYWPLRAFSRGLLDEVPVDPLGVADIVSIDYVGKALMALLGLDEVTGTVHLVAGADAISNSELIELACRQFGRPPPRLVLGPSSTLEEAGVYLPYFGIEARLDDDRARALLAPLGVGPLPLREYFVKIIEYAERARWGKRGLTRQAAAAAAV